MMISLDSATSKGDSLVEIPLSAKLFKDARLLQTIQSLSASSTSLKNSELKVTTYKQLHEICCQGLNNN